MVFNSPGNLRSWAVLVQSSLSLFSVLGLDFQALMMATLGVKEILLCHGSGIWPWPMILQVRHTWNKVRSNHFYLGCELSPDKPTVYQVNWLRAKAWSDGQKSIS